LTPRNRGRKGSQRRTFADRPVLAFAVRLLVPCVLGAGVELSLKKQTVDIYAGTLRFAGAFAFLLVIRVNIHDKPS